MVCLSPSNVEVFSCSWKSISPSPFLSTSLAEAWLLAFSKSAWEILRRYSSTKPQPDQELMIGYYMVLHAITYSIPKYTGLLQHVLIVLNATAESPLSFQHLGVHWGRSAPRLWLHHRSRPPAGWWAATDGIRFQHAAQPCGQPNAKSSRILKIHMLHSSTGAIWCRCTRHHVFIRLCQLITADGARAVFVKDPVRRIGLGVGSVFPNGAFHKWMGTQIKWFISWKIMENPSINGWFGPPAIRKPPEKYILPTWRLPSTHPPQCTFSCRGKSPSGTKSTECIDECNETYSGRTWDSSSTSIYQALRHSVWNFERYWKLNSQGPRRSKACRV